MKYIISTILLVCLTFQLHSQKIITKNFSLKGNKSVDLDIEIADSILIKTWKKDEVSIKFSININDNMKNDAYEVRFYDNEYSVKVKTDIDESHFEDVKKRVNKGNNHFHYHGKDIRVDVICEVYLPETTELMINTISSDIEIDKYSGVLDVKSISGFIDLTVPKNLGIDFKIKTVTGTVYTDLTFDESNVRGNDLKQIIGSNIRNSINDGGKRMRLETISSDIYLRKDS